MIRSINTRSRNGETADVLDKTINAFNNSTLTTDPYLTLIFSELQPKSSLMVDAIKYSKTESEHEGADLFRDDKARGLFFGVKSSLYNDTPAVKTAAEKIEKILDKYGWNMINESYAEESALVKSLLKDLSNPSLADDITAVPGCAEAIVQLQDAQIAFDAASDAFEAAKSVDSQQISATKLKKEIIDYMNKKLVVYLNGMQAVNDTIYGTLSNNVAQIIADNNSRVKRRSANGNDNEQPEA